MWDWLLAQAQQASPFIAVFCLLMLAGAGIVIRILYKQHLTDADALRVLASESTIALVRVARVLERQTVMLNARSRRRSGSRDE